MEFTIPNTVKPPMVDSAPSERPSYTLRSVRSARRTIASRARSGEVLGEQSVMWWNFIGRSHDEVVAYREQWRHEVIAGADAAGRFGSTVYDGPALPAPALPTVRLRARG